jgi:steroid delta-isomerase-like uncharacterized protein
MTPRTVVERYFTEVLEGAGPGSAADIISSEELRQRTHRLRTAFPDLEVEVLTLIAEDDFVAGHFVGRGTHRGLFNGVPPSGHSWEARGTGIYRVESGRIAEAWVNWDQLSLMEQLGAVERVNTVSA